MATIERAALHETAGEREEHTMKQHSEAQQRLPPQDTPTAACLMKTKTFAHARLAAACLAVCQLGAGLSLPRVAWAHAAAAALTTPWAFAAGASGPVASAPGASAPTATTPLAQAEVRRVELATGRLQLRHGPIPKLDMPPMTMVFRVKSPDLLQGLKEGDLILFDAEKIDGVYMVTHIEKRP
jgi:Cu/Ag efflux protein CusF